MENKHHEVDNANFRNNARGNLEDIRNDNEGVFTTTVSKLNKK